MRRVRLVEEAHGSDRRQAVLTYEEPQVMVGIDQHARRPQTQHGAADPRADHGGCHCGEGDVISNAHPWLVLVLGRRVCEEVPLLAVPPDGLRNTGPQVGRSGEAEHALGLADVVYPAVGQEVEPTSGQRSRVPELGR